MVSVECHMDPNVGKATGTERTVASCRESQSTLLRRVNFVVFYKNTMMTPPSSSNYNKDGSPEAADLSWVLLEKKKA